MRRNLLRFWGAVALLMLMAACAPTETVPSGEILPTPATVETPPTATPIPSAAEPTPTATPTQTPPALDFTKEPTLDEFSASIAVPDFLTEEQQELYRRAHCLYLHLFGVTTANVDRLGGPQSGFSNETVVIDDKTYTFSYGRYRNWADFDALVHAVFTERFWEERNNPVSAVGEPWVLFREYNGALCYLETEKGQGYFYNENVPDEFRLEEKTDDEIKFILIGHYYDAWPMEATDYDYTLEFPIKMVLTEDGWRFDEFYSALADEGGGPQDQVAEDDKVTYVDERLGFAMEFPESWRGKLEAEPEYDLDHRDGGHRVTFYHKPTREACNGGVLFYIDCYPGVWTADDPPVIAGSSIRILQTDEYTFFFRTPSDVQWHEQDKALELDYKAFMADFEFVREHITPKTEAPSFWLPALDFTKEPPLDEFSASIAVPDFLTEEQQDLYRRARFLYQHMFGGETTAVDSIRPDVETEYDAPERMDHDGLYYYPATGRYRNWADFDAVVHGLFTDEFWQWRNVLNDGTCIYREIDGRLWMADLSRGSGYYWNGNFPDEFRLDKQTEEEVAFTVIGHYSPVWPKEGESSEERNRRREREYEYTLEFPIKMVLTDAGWRFDEFHSTLADEEPE